MINFFWKLLRPISIETEIPVARSGSARIHITSAFKTFVCYDYEDFTGSPKPTIPF
jgi:hypothetical protein